MHLQKSKNDNGSWESLLCQSICTTKLDSQITTRLTKNLEQEWVRHIGHAIVQFVHSHC